MAAVYRQISSWKTLAGLEAGQPCDKYCQLGRALRGPNTDAAASPGTDTLSRPRIDPSRLTTEMESALYVRPGHYRLVCDGA